METYHDTDVVLPASLPAAPCLAHAADDDRQAPQDPCSLSYRSRLHQRRTQYKQHKPKPQDCKSNSWSMATGHRPWAFHALKHKQIPFNCRPLATLRSWLPTTCRLDGEMQLASTAIARVVGVKRGVVKGEGPTPAHHLRKTWGRVDAPPMGELGGWMRRIVMGMEAGLFGAVV